MFHPRWRRSNAASHSEPVFLLRRDLPQFRGQWDTDMKRYSALEICLAVEKVYGKETILGAREIRGLWRIYPLSRPARSQLLIEGLNLRGHALPLYDKNPFILKGQDGKERPTTKLWISNIPISCDGADTESAIFCYRIC